MQFYLFFNIRIFRKPNTVHNRTFGLIRTGYKCIRDAYHVLVHFVLILVFRNYKVRYRYMDRP